MDVVLIILGVLGLGAIVIAAYVFTVAARNYVSNDLTAPRSVSAASTRDRFIPRDPRDRRHTDTMQFPLIVNNMEITQDRRKQPERRAAA